MKKLLIALLSLAMILSLVACTAKTPTETTAQTVETGVDTDVDTTGNEVETLPVETSGEMPTETEEEVRYPEAVTIAMPDGAPALSMAELMAKACEFETFKVVDSTTITTYVTGENPEADICVLPVNAAAKLLGKGDVYQLLGVATHGNLYLMSQDLNTLFYEGADLKQLVGKTVGVIQLQNVPGLTLKVILDKFNVPYQDLANDTTPAQDKVNLKPLTDATEVVPNGGCDVYVCPEPAASLKAEKTPLDFVGDLQVLYDDEKGYPQACVVVKKSFAESYGAYIREFVERIQANEPWLMEYATNPTVICDAIAAHISEGMTPSLNPNNLSKTAILGSSVHFSSSETTIYDVNRFLEAVLKVNPKATAMPEEAFYALIH